MVTKSIDHVYQPAFWQPLEKKPGKECLHRRIDIDHLESTGAANCSSSAPTKPFSQARLQLDEYGDHDDGDGDDDENYDGR